MAETLSMDKSGRERSESEINSDVKIICVGLMRTGLQSLHKAFDILGYPNIYDQERTVNTYVSWGNVIGNREPKEAFHNMFKGCDIVLGMPTFCFWEDIHELYPNAKIILTTRAEDGWWASVDKAKNAMDYEVPGAPLRSDSVLRYVEHLLVPTYFKFTQVLRFAWASTLGGCGQHGKGLNESAARGAFRKHNAYVKSFFEKRKTKDGSPQLLVFDVREGWEPLCKFLGKDMPKDIAFPSKENLRVWPEGPQAMPDWYDKVTGFDELFAPDGDLGSRMRTELRKGLLVWAVVITAVLALCASVTLYTSTNLTWVVAFIYLSLILIGWTTYGVAMELVVRVPLLMVLPLAMKGMMIAAALHLCFITYGILKEMLVTQDKVSSSVLVLSSRMMSIICACTYMLITEKRITLGAPILDMSMFAFTNEASTWAGYEMLKYVSFPLQVMAKSVKMLPNMLMGKVLNGTQYSMYQYAQAVAALICVGIMHFSGEQDEKPKKGKPGAEHMTPNHKLMMGIAMLAVFFVTDAFTSNWQTALYKKHPKITQVQMMLGGNMLGFIFTAGSTFLMWKEKDTTSIMAAYNSPPIFWRIVALGVVSALGQFTIYTAIRVLGSLSFTWIMTARQLLSVLISLIFFGHGVNLIKIVCILVVFAIMSAKQLAPGLKMVVETGRDKVDRVSRRLSKRSVSKED